MQKIKKILIIGSGPIIIGQAAEFDYSGTQACLSLKEEGYEVVLINPNPATIMTDKNVADKIYLEPLTVDFCKWIIVKEKVDAIMPGFGGQIALNLATNLYKLGYLKKYNVKILGTSINTIIAAENRQIFKKMMNKINIKVAESIVINNLEEGLKNVNKIGFPIVIRPSFTMGGLGGNIAKNMSEFKEYLQSALKLSPISECLIEKSLLGFKEIEYEIMRDASGTSIVVCNMENLDPVGVHTGDSIVVSPSLTLTNKEYQNLRDISIKICNFLKIKGGCNVQLATNPNKNEVYVIEINPRVSRSSALASKATGYPIAKISAKIGIGKLLKDIINPITKNTTAAFEPSIDYIVTKIPKFPFDKFAFENDVISTHMQATGETMSIGKNFCESFLKGIRGLENNEKFLWSTKIQKLSTNELLKKIKIPSSLRMYQLYEIIRRKVSLEKINRLTSIDMYFLYNFKKIFMTEQLVIRNKNNINALLKAKKYGFSDYAIAILWDTNENDIYKLRQKHNIFPKYNIVDTCAGEFLSLTPYFYSTYSSIQNDINIIENNKKILILGSGPIRIGQGIEFDYSTVHSIQAIKNNNYEAAVINNNPETVSTDYSISNYLFFEPITYEDVMNIVNYLKPKHLILQFGGQTALNLTNFFENSNEVNTLGTKSKNIKLSENRLDFFNCLKKLKIITPDFASTNDITKLKTICKKIKYPVLIRPSFVIGGRAMQILYSDDDLEIYLKDNYDILNNNQILIDKYIEGIEYEIDCVCDGKDIWIPGILEHIEQAGVHSGDSTIVFPSKKISQTNKQKIYEIIKKIALDLNVFGLMNVQLIYDKKNDKIYIIESNLRSSRTIPFISKAININVIDVTINCLLGKSLKTQNRIGINQEPENIIYVKSPVFSFSKIPDQGLGILGPEMQSTGEAWGSDSTLAKALYKSLLAANIDPLRHHAIFVSVSKKYRQDSLAILKRMSYSGYKIYATENTYKELKKNHIESTLVNKIGKKNNVIDLINNVKLSFIVNIVGESYKKRKHLLKMRRCAFQYNVVVLTNINIFNEISKICFEMKFLIKPI